MKIEILYFGGCPNSDPTLAAIREVMTDLSIRAEITETVVRNDDEARRLQFLGSPTVRVDGIDIEPEALDRKDFVMSCRMYGNSGVPPRNLIEAALVGAERS